MDPTDSNQPPESARVALRHHVVQRLLVKIIRGELGPGTRLIANTLAHQFGVSATPVREALVELEQSGMIELVHHRGALVKAFGCDELQDFFHFRSLLQCDAVQLACGRVALPRLDALDSEVRRLRGEPSEDGCLVKDIFRVDQRIKMVLVDHCHNKWLVAELGRHDSIESALREIVESSPLHDRDAFSPAAELAAALRKGDPNAGASAMQRHIGVLAAAIETNVFDRRP